MTSQFPPCCWQGLHVEQAAGILLFDLFAHEVMLVRDSRGAWRFASGRLEPEESAVEAAMRELAEEAGILAQDYDIIPTSIPLVKPRQPANGKEHHAKVTLLFPAVVRSPRAQIVHGPHEPKSTPGWYSMEDAVKITRSTSRAACLILGYQVAEHLHKRLDEKPSTERSAGPA